MSFRRLPFLLFLLLLPSSSSQNLPLDIPLDIPSDGACADLIAANCIIPSQSASEASAASGASVPAASNALCLRTKVFQKQRVNGMVNQQQVQPVSPSCKSEFHSFMVALQTDVRNNPLIKEACLAELEPGGICGDQPSGPYFMQCLRMSDASTLSKACNDAVGIEKVESSLDIQLDAVLYSACEPFVTGAGACGDGVAEGVGDKWSCLQELYGALDGALDGPLDGKCKEEVFKKIQEGSNDVNTMQSLLNGCSGEIALHCATAANADLLNCLWDNRKSSNFGRECRKKVSVAIEEQDHDYRLNYRLKNACKNDYAALCRDELNALSSGVLPATLTGSVIECLEAKYESIQSKECKETVDTTIAQQSSSFFNSVTIRDKCADDAKAHCCDGDACDDLTQGNRIMKCLKDSYDALNEQCQHEILMEIGHENYRIQLKPDMEAACRRTIQNECSNVESGGNLVISCLQEHRDDVTTSEECRKELDTDSYLTGKDYRLKYGITHDCVDDMNELCDDELEQVNSDSPTHGGAVLSCLVRNRKRIRARECTVQVKTYQKSVMENWRNSVDVKSACSEDVQKYCGNVVPGHGKVHECFLGHISHVHGDDSLDVVSEECARSEFEIMVEKIEDVDLDEGVLSDCHGELDKFCNVQGIRDANGGGVDCLESNLAATPNEYTDKCAKRINAIIELKNRDARLDLAFISVCKNDINDLCPSVSSSMTSSNDLFSHQIIDCLIENRSNIKTGPCKRSVNKKMRQRAADWNANPDVHDACVEDASKFCKYVLSANVGEGKVHACLFEHIQELSQQCADAEFKEQIIKSEDIMFNPLLFRGCVTDVKKWCMEVDDKDKIACLQEHYEDDEMTQRCKDRLTKENVKEGENIAFNPRLFKACLPTLKTFTTARKTDCIDASVFRGDFKKFFRDDSLYAKSLSCLTTNSRDIKDDACKAQVFKKEAVGNENIDFRAQLKIACTDDVRQFCVDIPKGKSSVIRCLEDHLKDLSPSCKEQITKVKANQDQDIMLRPVAKRACGNEMKVFCDGIGHGDQRMYACLKANIKKTGFGAPCKFELGKVKISSALVAATTVAINAGGNNNGSASSGIVLSGPLAAIALFSLACMVVFVGYCVWKRRGQSAGNYRVVLPRELSGRDEGDRML
jgi:Golgi apparatus protein 1